MISQKRIGISQWFYLLFMVYPFLAFSLAYRFLHNRIGRLVFILFYGLFGFLYTFPRDGDIDAVRHEDAFFKVTKESFPQFTNTMYDRITFSGAKPDFFQYVIEFTISRFTNNSQFLFCTLCLIMAYLVMLNIKYLQELYIKNKSIFALFFIVFFLVLMMPYRIISFRHNSAMLVFLFSAYQVLVNNRKLFLLGIYITIFMHFGFGFAILIFTLYYLLGNRNYLYLILAIVSFFYVEMAPDLINAFGEEKVQGDMKVIVKGYSKLSYIEQVQELRTGGNVIISNHIKWTKWFFFWALLFWKMKIKRFDKGTENLFSLSLLFFAGLGFVSVMISISDRFSLLYILLCCVILVRMFTLNQFKRSYAFLVIASVFFIMDFMVVFRQNMLFTNVLLFVPGFPIQLLIDSNFSLLDIYEAFKNN